MQEFQIEIKEELARVETIQAETGLSTLFQTNFFRLFSRYCTGV